MASTASCTNRLTILPQLNFHNAKNERLRSSFLRPRSSDLRRSGATRIDRFSNRNLVIRNATPEVAGDLVSSFPLSGIPGFSLLGDNPWLAGAAGLFVGVPLLVQRLVTFTKEVDMAAQTVEKIADAVEKVADEVDKAAENLAESLPEGGFKKVVTFIEDMAEETAKDAQMVEDLMDKVEEIDDKLEEFMNKQVKGPGKA